MEQGKSIFHHIRAFIMYHKTISILIGCVIMLDISLVGVVTEVQKKELQQKNIHSTKTSPTITNPPAQPK